MNRRSLLVVLFFAVSACQDAASLYQQACDGGEMAGLQQPRGHV